MIPLIDAYLRETVNNKIEFLKKNPDIIDKIFGTLGSKTTLKSFKKFVTERTINVLIGFPREPQQLPCYVIMVAGEQEQPIGLGDNIDDYESEYDEDELTTHYVLDGIDMKSTYRIECWTDNGDLAAYMYALLKWCLLSARKSMLQAGFKLPSISGTDLEPVPDYIPTFVYRRALMITFLYENLYFDDETLRGDGEFQFPLGVTPDDIKLVQTAYKPMEDESDI